MNTNKQQNSELCLSPVSGSRNVVIIGKLTFKDAEEFKDYADDKMHEFLSNIQDLNGYTRPPDEIGLFEYEEGITFYYTKKGSALVYRWIARMQKIFDQYFPYDYGFEPKCCYWKVF